MIPTRQADREIYYFYTHLDQHGRFRWFYKVAAYICFEPPSNKGTPHLTSAATKSDDGSTSLGVSQIGDWHTGAQRQCLYRYSVVQG